MRRAFAAALLALLPPLSAAPAFAQTFAGAASEAGAAFRAPGAPLALPPAALAFSPAAPVPALSAAFAAPAAPAATLELAAAPAAAVPPAVPADAVPAAAAASPAETVVPTEPRAPIDGLRDGFSPTEGNSNTAPTVNFDGAAAAPAAPKRIAVYMDGTWDSETHRDKNGVLVPTNVQKLSRMSSDGAGQVSRYFQGVGTHPWDRWTGGTARLRHLRADQVRLPLRGRELPAGRRDLHLRLLARRLRRAQLGRDDRALRRAQEGKCGLRDEASAAGRRDGRRADQRQAQDRRRRPRLRDVQVRVRPEEPRGRRRVQGALLLRRRHTPAGRLGHGRLPRHSGRLPAAPAPPAAPAADLRGLRLS